MKGRRRVGGLHAVEAALCVEAALAGALLVSVNRSTYDEQPVSAFGLLNRSRMVADWVCRLSVW